LLNLTTELDFAFIALELHELEVRAPVPDFDAEVADAETAGRAGSVGDPTAARALYRRFGTDPTKVRPSSEALLRRVKKGDRLPRVNSLVDVANVVSLCLQVPIGLYDLDLVEGPLEIKLGLPGEGYEGIRKERVNVAGRICVADAFGPCGNPSSDSARTMITTATERAAWIFFLPVAMSDLHRTFELVAEYGRGLARVL
jgi:DNA/RNA-binding domain of Phe-tRNA-synthetase-like protein